MSALTAKQLQTLKRELRFIGREISGYVGGGEDEWESIDAIAGAVEVALTTVAEIERQDKPETVSA